MKSRLSLRIFSTTLMVLLSFNAVAPALAEAANKAASSSTASSQTVVLPAADDAAAIPEAKKSAGQIVTEEPQTPDPEETQTAPDPGVVDPVAKRDNAGAQPKEHVGEYNVDEFSGAFNYSYPISIPAGRNNVQPQVALNYNHQRVNIGSFVGFGWDIPMPAVERQARNGVDKLYTDNYFSLNLSGNADLEPISVDANGYGTYGKKSEDDFSKIEYSASGWIVTDKMGTKYTFGVDSASRQDNPNDTTKVYKWLLTEIRDTNDNYVRYEYYKDSGQIYPKKIVYTGNGSTDGIYEVDFQPFASGTPTEDNLTSISYKTGFAVQTKYLLHRIEVKTKGVVTSAYDLTFTLNQGGLKKLLTAIQPRAYQAGQEYSKDRVDLSYSVDVLKYKQNDVDYKLPNSQTLGYSNTSSGHSERKMFIDVNQDGYADYVYMNCDSGNLTMTVYENNTNGNWSHSGNFDLNLGTGYSCFFRTSIPAMFGEVNGDHKIDLITQNNYYINSGTGWTQTSATIPVPLSDTQNPGGKAMNSASFMDMNGDGYDDLVYNDNATNSISNIVVYSRIPGAGWVINHAYDLSVTAYHGDCFTYGGSPYGYTDINNDGLVDVFYNYACRMIGTSENRSAVYLNSGSSLQVSSAYTSNAIMSKFDMLDSGQNTFFLTDMSGSGVANSSVLHRIINGGSPQTSAGQFTANSIQVFDTGLLNSGNYYSQPIPVAIADFNGDQIQDIMHSSGAGPAYALYLGSNIKPDVLKKVQYQSGAFLQMYYDYSAKQTDLAGNKLNPQLPFNLYVVKDVVVGNSLDSYEGNHYSYASGLSTSYPADKIKDMYGFGKVAVQHGVAAPDVDLGTGVDGAYISSGNDTWTTDKNFTSLLIQSGHTITVKPNVKIKVQGLAQIDGILSADGQGYTGGASTSGSGNWGNGSGKGHGGDYIAGYGMGGGGASYQTAGENASNWNGGYGIAGDIYGNQELSPIDMGSGGGSGSGAGNSSMGGYGGNGGGIIQLFSDNTVINGFISANGLDGGEGNYTSGDHYAGGGGGGSGGTVLLRSVHNVSIGSSRILVNGGAGKNGGASALNRGGSGGYGRIRIEGTQVTGSTYPIFYRYGQFEYSINNVTSDPTRTTRVTTYGQATGITFNDSYYLHGKKKQEQVVDVNNNLVRQQNYTYSTASLAGTRKFLSLDKVSEADLKYSLGDPLHEYVWDSGTAALFHMNGGYGTSQKKSSVSGSYQLVEGTGSATADSFNGLSGGAYYAPSLSTTPISLGSSWTIEFWFNARSLPVNNSGFFQTTAPNGNWIGLGLSGQDHTYHLGVEIISDPNPRPTVVTNFPIQQGQWYHLALVENGGNDLRLYINGAEAARDTVNAQPNLANQTLIFGESYTSGVPIWLDELRISTVARSASEIANYYSVDPPSVIVEGHTKQMTYDSSNGNVLTEQDLGKVNVDVMQGTVTDITGDEKTTTYAYASNSTKHILAAPMTKTVAGLGESKPEDFYYDQQAHGDVDKANVTKEDLKSNTVDIETTYNSFGLPLTKKDPKDNTAATLSYDSDNMFVATSTDALGRSTVTKTDPVTGQLLYSRDPNGYQEKYSYDAWGRVTKKEVSDPANVATLITKQEVSYGDVTNPRYREIKDYFKSGSYTTSREYYDGLGRVIQTSTLAAGNQYVTTYKQYDGQGRLAQESLPLFTASADFNTSPSFTNAKVTTFDAQGRPLTETTPTGTTSYSYDGLVTTITDPRTKVKKLTNDAFGNLVKVEESNSGATYTTNYEYSLTNKLKKITDALGNIRTFTYDALDNLTQQDMVHTAGTSNPGHWTYTYDKNGNVLSKVDLKSQTSNYSYDALNRLLTENFTGKTGTEYTMTYDQGTKQLGRLTRVVGSDGLTTVYTYDPQGKPLTVVRTIDGTSYTLTYAYDWNGNVTSITYPEGERIDYLYNAVGQINQVNKVKNGTTTVLASGVTYTPMGQIAHLQRGNNVTTDYTYDANQNYRLTRIRTVSGSVVLQDIAYTYDANGNILTIIDSSQTALAKNVAYGYDDLNRLISATVTNSGSGANYSHTYSYDAIGNILSSTPVGSYTYTLSNPHQARTAGSTTLTYDNNGNVVYINQDHQSYDWRDRMTYSAVAGSADHTEYVYDHANQRVKKHTLVYVPAGGGADCETHPDQCPDPIYGIPRELPPVVTPPPGKLPLPIEVIVPTTDQEGEVSSINNQDSNNIQIPSFNNQTGEVTAQTVETESTPTAPILTVEPAEPLPIGIFPIPTTTPETIATSTDPIITPDPTLIEPIVSIDDVASTTDQANLSLETPTPDAAPAAQDIATYYIDKYYEKQYNGVSRNHYFLGTINLAVEPLSGANAGVYYILSDHLGSSSLTTNSFGNMTDRTDYYPYGSIAATASNLDIGDHYKYTGKELDSETNLSYYGARYYGQNIGKFMAIDPYGQKMSSLVKLLPDPQGLNGYSYTRNNPIIMVDPDGRNPLLAVLFALGLVLFSDAQPAQAPTLDSPSPARSDVNKSLADIASPAYGRLNSVQKTAIDFTIFGVISSVDKTATGFIDRFVANKFRSFMERDIAAAETKAVQNLWFKSTFDKVEDSILYHFDEKAAAFGKSVAGYTSDARNFWRANQELIEKGGNEFVKIIKTQLKDGSDGVLFRTRGGGQGGYFSPDGKIVSFWYQ